MSLWNRLKQTFSISDGRLASFFVSPTKSGKSVNEVNTLGLSAAWSCIRLISQIVSTLPGGLYQGRGPERREVSDHWLADRLTISPNADQTPAEFWEGMVGCMALRGNAYARKAMLKQSGEFAALETMFPDNVQLQRSGRTLTYIWTDPEGKRVELPEKEVFHLKGFGLGGDLGLSPVAFARESLGAAIAAEESAAGVFSNGMQSSGFLTVDQELTPKQRPELEKIMKDYVGSDNAGKMMILEAGMNFVPINMKPEEAQLLLTRRFNVEEICRWFGVPPILVGHAPEGQTMWGSGVEQLMIAWLTTGLNPWLVKIEQAITKRAMPAEMRRAYKFEFNPDGLLRADSQGRALLYSSYAQNGLRTRDEIRRLDNLPPLPGGDMLTVQSNLVPLQDLPKILEGGGGPAQEAAKALRAWILPELAGLLEGPKPRD